MKELLLETFTVLEELDVVDQQDVDVAIAALERRVGVGANGVDELVEERLGGDVAHSVVLVVVVDVVADGVQQVGLAESGRAIDEQRVVRARRRLGDAQGGGEGELVRGSLDERLERVPRIEAGLVEQRRAVRPRVESSIKARRRRPREQVVGEVGRRRWCHDDVQSAPRCDDLIEGARHQRQIPGEDAVAHVVARHADLEVLSVGRQRDHVLERRVPDDLRELVS